MRSGGFEPLPPLGPLSTQSLIDINAMAATDLNQAPRKGVANHTLALRVASHTLSVVVGLVRT